MDPCAHNGGVRPSFGVVIPARYQSTRLPGKALLDLDGEPMVVHVLRNAGRSGAAFVVVATDDERIAAAVARAGGEAVMTSPDHQTGTDRLAEVVERRGLGVDDIVVNVQGDEPLINPAHIARVAAALHERRDAGVATLATHLRDAELFEPSVVKVVINEQQLAVTFSRAPIPRGQNEFGTATPRTELSGPTFLRHVGLYAYRVRALRAFAAQARVELEKAESLEQLRAMWLGIPIHVTVLDDAYAPGVDTPADVDTVIDFLRRRRAGRTSDEEWRDAGAE
jgi:3-deoxy-manno-octulosonate cytidylyltransferase (CMP-KDO synthetase)